MTTELRVIHEDLAVLKFCNKGSRAFFARHNLDWTEFMQQGIEVSRLQEIDDAMSQAAIAQAKRRVGAKV